VTSLECVFSVCKTFTFFDNKLDISFISQQKITIYCLDSSRRKKNSKDWKFYDSLLWIYLSQHWIEGIRQLVIFTFAIHLCYQQNNFLSVVYIFHLNFPLNTPNLQTKVFILIDQQRKDKHTNGKYISNFKQFYFIYCFINHGEPTNIFNIIENLFIIYFYKSLGKVMFYF
jgi:hypothetical protein